ncbi:probable RNA polymerase sigma factor [Oleispira antarctica RB-8]|uniref:Probable RNA polymerase sigma factor n=1 Tax=Oleispira antarctica RB-8 TaxID=698738 RepID=R4YTA0_OLEAN|nr:probable RNA polymerase sigma factor [Oleispira antarctica RB-8]
MSAIKLYFCQFHEDEPTTIRVHRDLMTLMDEWEQCDQASVVGLVHVGFVRPKVQKIPPILKYKGQVLSTSAAKWALPLDYRCSHSVVFELDVSNKKIPIHLVVEGFGYQAEEPGGMAIIEQSLISSSNTEMTIVNAALVILKDTKKPLNKEEIYANIVEQELYQFGAKKPVSVLGVELNRYCGGTDYSNPAEEPLFGKTHDGKFYSLDNAPRDYEDWLVDLEYEEPELLTELIPYGISNEQSYLSSAHKLERRCRDKIDMFRYQVMYRRIDSNNIEEFLKILPESIRRVDLSLLGLTVRILNVLKLQSISCLADLDGISLGSMMRWPNFGRKSANDIHNIISSEIEVLMDQVSMVSMELGVIESNSEVVVEEGEDYVIEKISAKPLKEHFENALSQLKEKHREVIEHRTGYHGRTKTLEEVGCLIGVTRERVRQIQKKYVEKIIEREFWDDCIAIKIGQMLIDRNEPLYLEMLEVEDKWFAGFMGNYSNLAAIIEMFSEAEIRIIKINGANIVTRIKKDDWETGISQFRISLKDKAADGNWTRSDINMTFKSFLTGYGAEELLSLLWDQFSDSLQFSGESDENKLLGFGRTAEAAVRAVLVQAEKPLHYSEIAMRASAILGKAVDERRAHGAAPTQGGLLYGRGVYGLAHFNPVSERMCKNIILVVVQKIYDGPLNKQWHCNEIIAQLKAQFPALPGELDHYVLNIILGDSEKLVYLNRMVWARADSEQKIGDRIDMADAYVKILEDAGGPLKGSELRQRLQNIRGLGDTVQLQPNEYMLQIGPDFWGLLERDVKGSQESIAKTLDALYLYLKKERRGIHVTEVDAFLNANDLSENSPVPYALLNLSQRDDRFHLAKAMFLGLTEWDGSMGRLNFSQGIRKVLADMGVPMGIAEITVKLEEVVGLRLDQPISNLLITQGGVYNPQTKKWFRKIESPSSDLSLD